MFSLQTWAIAICLLASSKKIASQEEGEFCDRPIEDAIEAAASDITSLIQTQNNLAPKYVRLSFHDCVGGCDGCVDLQNPDNFGLDVPMDSLLEVVERYRHTGLTRADIWALAGITGLNFADPENGPDFFSFEYFGRAGCEDVGTPCLDAGGVDVGCTPATGPHRHLPPANMDTEDLLDFFADEFGFDEQRVAALMGAHTIGTASLENSGFNGPVGWVPNGQNERLDNRYYSRIVGEEGFPFADAPGWQMNRLDNGKHQWEQNNGSIMLNADVALVRTFGDQLNRETGEVQCNFRSQNGNNLDRVCPGSRMLPQMAIYHNNNDLWRADFKEVFETMIVHDYTPRNSCNSLDCVELVNGQIITCSPTPILSHAPSILITSQPSTPPSASSFPSNHLTTSSPIINPSSMPSYLSTVEPSSVPSSSLKPSGTGIWTILSFDDFESGWGSFKKGGNDAKLIKSKKNKNKPTFQGKKSVMIRDNTGSKSSVVTAEFIDVSSCSFVEITFKYFVQKFKEGEDFMLEYRTSEASSWITHKAWAYQTEFSALKKWLTGTEIIDTSGFDSFKIRLRCDASSNRDQVYLDNIEVKGFC